MYKRAFLFNGSGSKLVKLPPELMDKYEYYMEAAFGRLGLNKDLEKNNVYDSRTAEWIISLICDRVVFEHYIDKGIIPDIGAGYSMGIVSISGCFGSVPHEFAQDIIMTTRATMRSIDKSSEKLDTGIVIGFSYSDIEEMLKDKFSPDEIVIGSGNSNFHVMISGRAEAVEKALLLCQNEGAIKVFRFGPGMAFHHPIMKKYSQEFVDFCGSIEYSDPVYPILSASDREIMTKGKQIMRETQLSVYTPIRWDLAISKLEELGVTEFFDVSANAAVSKFSRVSRKCRIYTLEDV